MGLQRWPIKDYRGGLNTADGPFNLENNEAQDLLNVSLTEKGAIKQRDGWTILSQVAEAQVINHLRPWYPSPGTRHLLASVDGDIVKLDTAGVRTLVFNGTAGTIWAMEQNTDVGGTRFLWAMNGTDTPKMIATDGVTVGNWVATTGGVPNGTMLRVWKNRFWVAGVAAQPQRLYYSGDSGSSPPFVDPRVWPATNFIDIKSTEDDLDPITWIEILGDHLIVFKRQSIWAVTNPITADNFRIGPVGVEARFQSCELEGRMYFVNRGGLYSTRGLPGDIQYESHNLENLFTGNQIDDATFDRARIASTPDRHILISCGMSSDNGENNTLFEYLPFVRTDREGGSRGAWLKHNIRASAIATFRTASSDDIVFGDVGTNRVAKLFNGNNDNGVAIAAHWHSSWREIQPEEPYERLRRINVLMQGDLVLDVYRDFEAAPAFSQSLIAEEPADPLWDGGVWDGGVWTPEPAVVLNRARPETRGRYHSIKFRNSQLDKSFTVYSAEMALRGGKEH